MNTLLAWLSHTVVWIRAQAIMFHFRPLGFFSLSTLGYHLQIRRRWFVSFRVSCVLFSFFSFWKIFSVISLGLSSFLPLLPFLPLLDMCIGLLLSGVYPTLWKIDRRTGWLFFHHVGNWLWEVQPFWWTEAAWRIWQNSDRGNWEGIGKALGRNWQ